MRYLAALIIGVAIMTGACGSSDHAIPTKPGTTSSKTVKNLRPPDRYTEADVIKALNLKDEDPDFPGLSWTTPSGISSISVIMTNRETVELYAGAGDQVATNPAGTVGLKFSGDDAKGGDAAAAQELTRGLAKLP